MMTLLSPLLAQVRGRDGCYQPPTGSREAVACLGPVLPKLVLQQVGRAIWGTAVVRPTHSGRQLVTLAVWKRRACYDSRTESAGNGHAALRSRG
jgi:hypothetical protein